MALRSVLAATAVSGTLRHRSARAERRSPAAPRIDPKRLVELDMSAMADWLVGGYPGGAIPPRWSGPALDHRLHRDLVLRVAQHQRAVARARGLTGAAGADAGSEHPDDAEPTGGSTAGTCPSPPPSIRRQSPAPERPTASKRDLHDVPGAHSCGADRRCRGLTPPCGRRLRLLRFHVNRTCAIGRPYLGTQVSSGRAHLPPPCEDFS